MFIIKKNMATRRNTGTIAISRNTTKITITIINIINLTKQDTTKAVIIR